MRPVNQTARKVLERLRTLAVEARPDQPYVKLNNGGDGIMAVSVERIRATGGAEVWAVAHYFEQNGDLCADPSIEFLRGPSGWYPLTFQQDPWPGFKRYVELDGATLVPTRYNKRMQADCAVFCGTWMRNVKHQQRLGA